MSNERFFPSYHQIKARKAVRVYWKKAMAAVKQPRSVEMRQIQQLLQEVKMKIATYNVRVDTEYDQDWQWFFVKRLFVS